MSYATRSGSAVKVSDVLGSVRQKGVRLWAENGQLRYAGPKGALTEDERRLLRVSKNEILARLEVDSEGPTRVRGPTRRRETDRVPLTLCQQSHWRWYRLGERRHLRQIASATRLCGVLDIEALRSSVDVLVRRHESLRTRIGRRDGLLTQEIRDSCDLAMPIADLSAVPPELRAARVEEVIRNHILEPVDVTVDALLALRLIRLEATEHVLIVSMEHLISDAYSMNLFLREIMLTYSQIVQGVPVSLPTVALQYGDFAVWLERAQAEWLRQHGSFWKEQLLPCPRVRFPSREGPTFRPDAGWGAVPVQVDRESTARLREWSRANRTTLPLAVFTAYAAVVLRWCETRRMVIRYVSDGRTNPKIENTIGFFAFFLTLRIEVSAQDTFLDLLNQVMREYGRAHEQADWGYGDAQEPRPEYVRNTAFNWIPRPSITAPSAPGSAATLVCSPVEFEHPLIRLLERDTEPSLELFDTEESIFGSVHFPSRRHSAQTMRGFARNFQEFLRMMLAHPGRRLADVDLI